MKPKNIQTIVRRNLLTVKDYSPYCGNDQCREMPRSIFYHGQFRCSACGWESTFPKDFIAKYLAFQQKEESTNERSTKMA